MSFRVSRRNRRTASSRKALTKEKALLAISALIFLGGIGSLAWTLASHAQAHEPPAPTPARTQSDDLDDGPSYGSIVSSRSASSSSSSSASSASSAAPQTAAPEPPMPSESEEESVASPSIPASAPAYEPQPSAQPSTVVHHDAYQELPSYRVVHHQASIPREVSSGGYTRIEWTSCPVCGQKHDAAYNERVVDHVTEVLCSACGAKHAASYDEVLY